MRPFFVLLTSAMLIVSAGCLALDRSVVFIPSRYPVGNWRPEGQDFEEAWFKSPDGTRLHGWFAEARNPRAVVLHTHGNAGNVTHRVDLLRLYRDRFHASVFVFDYRGYGRSGGEPSEAGILADARAARRWLSQRTQVAETDIILHGTSLGGGVAVDLAARDGARGLILENTFTSIPDVASDHVKLLPARLLLNTRLDSLAKIRRYHGPLLQTHGDADRTIPFELGRRLFDATNEPKQFVRVPGGDHNDPPSPAFIAALDHFLDSVSGQ
jgi:fermentation-respiration switch protein FrsA (DUF1100 family)